MLNPFRRSKAELETARRIYEAANERARAAVFFTRFQVPDTIDGRFDLLVLHVFFVMETLKRDAEVQGLANQLARVTFNGFEDALRELGVGDMGLSRRIKAMANAFYGRLEAYGKARSPEDWTEFLLRNLYRGDEDRRTEAERLGVYAQKALHRLEETDAGLALRQGQPDFGPLPD